MNKLYRQCGFHSFWIIIIIFVIIASFLVWSHYAYLDEYARGQGQIIAISRTQIVQSATDGVIEKYLVTQGEKVVKGELLVQLEKEQAKAALDDSNNKVAALKIALARLQAETFGHALKFEENHKKNYRHFVENQTALYRRRQQALTSEINNLQDSLKLIEDEVNIAAPLVATGDIGKVELLRLQRQVAEIEGKITNRRNQFFQDAQTEMTKVNEELAAQEQILAERQVVYERTDIKSPSDGIVKDIQITTPGAKVRPGDVIMELLPTDSDLIFELQLRPADVAFVVEGHEGFVKLDAFDSSIYGNIKAKVTYVSPDTLLQKTVRGDLVFYRVQLKLDQAAIDKHNRENPNKKIEIAPGMTGSVDIKTGRKTVWTYLTKPVTKTLSEALTER